MLSKKTKYGIQAVLYLAEKFNKGPVLISEIAKTQSLPKKFLEAILLELNKKGLLHSRKGKGGGYSLKRPPNEIMLGEVIRVLEGPLAPVSCVSQTAYRPCDECKDELSCGIKVVMKEVRDAISKILDHKSLADVFVQRKHEMDKFTVNYVI